MKIKIRKFENTKPSEKNYINNLVWNNMEQPDL